MRLDDFLSNIDEKKKAQTPMTLDEINKKIESFSVGNYFKMRKAIQEEEAAEKENYRTSGGKFNQIV